MPNHPDQLERVFRALSDPSRRTLVERLTRGPASVSELAALLPMALPSVIQHLGVLEEAGLLASEKVGRVRTCHIEPAALRKVEDWIADRRAEWDRRLDRLGDELALSDPPAGDHRHNQRRNP